MPNRQGFKDKIKKIKDLVEFRQSLINELNDTNDYQKKVEKIKKHYDDGKN